MFIQAGGLKPITAEAFARFHLFYITPLFIRIGNRGAIKPPVYRKLRGFRNRRNGLLGSVDFKFRNNTNYPLKIECYLQDQAVEIVFRGTDEHPGRVVTVETKIEQVYPFSVIEEIVPTLQPGQTVIKQSGMTGYYVTAKRIFKEGDKVEVEQLRPSWYSKLDQIVQKGAERVSTESTEAA